MVGEPIQVASAATNNMGAPWQQQVVMDHHGGGSVMEDPNLDDSMAIFLAGGYIDGTSRAMPAAIATGRDQFDGYFIAAGFEHMMSASSMIGFSLSFTDLEASASAGQTASGELFQGTVYASTTSSSGTTLSGQVSLGSFQSDTRQTVAIGPNNFNLGLTDDAMTFSLEAMFGHDLGKGNVSIVPNVALRYGMVDFGDAAQTGGIAALQFQRDDSLDSFQSRFGIDIGFGSASIRPRFNATYVHDLSDNPSVFLGNLVGGPAAGWAPFTLGVGQDRDWVEVSGGLQIMTDNIDIDFAVDSTVWRNDVRNQSYRATATLHF
jgi:outer membrane autotransporter protein